MDEDEDEDVDSSFDDGGGAYCGVFAWKKERMESCAGFIEGSDMLKVELWCWLAMGRKIRSKLKKKKKKQKEKKKKKKKRE